VPPGGEAPYVDLRLGVRRGYRIHGQVQANGWPIQLINLFSFPDRLAGPAARQINSVDSHGDFEFTNVPEGAYVLTAYASKVNAAGQPPNFRIAFFPVTVRQDIEGIQVPLGSYPEITGSIHTADPADQEAFLSGRRGDLNVFLSIPFGSHGGESIWVKGDGRLSLRTVPGLYDLTVRNVQDGYYVSSIRYNGEDVAKGSATVSGSVADSDGELLGDTPVIIWRVAQARAGQREVYMGASTDRDGNFAFMNLPPGEYRIAAWEGIEPGLAEYPGFHRAFESQAKRVSLGQNAALNFKLTAITSEASASQSLAVK
jgi:hypothetical protein